jgi:hypothetical protein
VTATQPAPQIRAVIETNGDGNGQKIQKKNKPKMNNKRTNRDRNGTKHTQ